MQTIEMILVIGAMALSIYAYGRSQYHHGYLDAMDEAIDTLKRKLEELKDDD